jgi:tetratricopeptide (TPR) repeat protein
MKRLNLFILLLFSTVIITNAQQPTGAPMLSFEGLEKKLEKSNKRIEHPKKSLKAKTWLRRGEVFQDINDVNTELLRVDMPATEIKLYYQEPNEIETVQEEGVQKEIYHYDRVKLTLQDGVLKSWEKTEKIHEKPLESAISSYRKVVDLDEDKKMEDDLEENLGRLKRQLEEKGILSFSQKKYKDAYRYFDLYTNVNDFYVFEGVVDTVIYYNAALAATNAKMYDEAIEYYNKAAKYNYGGENLYVFMKDVYMANGDTLQAAEALQEGFKKNPESDLLLVQLINYFLTSGESEEALEYLNMAKQNDPGNKSFYFAEGTLYDKMGNEEKAIEAYTEALEIDPNYFDAYYNLGVLHYNKAVELFTKANNTMDDEEYQQLRKEAAEQLEKALPFMEKALNNVSKEDDPDSYVATLETLKTLYYRLQKEDKHKETVQKLEEFQTDKVGADQQ